MASILISSFYTVSACVQIKKMEMYKYYKDGNAFQVPLAKIIDVVNLVQAFLPLDLLYIFIQVSC